MWGSNKVYTDTTGGVPTLVDWIDAMLDGTSAAGRTSSAGLQRTPLPGDPKPSMLPQDPFDDDGNIVCEE